jgi:uncharacterized membrane protein
MVVVGALSWSVGVSLNYSAIVIPLTSASTAFTVLLAFLVLKEKPELNQQMGILLIIIGLIALNL